MLHGGIKTSRSAQREMITAEHYTWLIGIAGARAWVPGRVSLHCFQPADQIPGGAADGSGARKRVRLCQVQPAHAGNAGRRLGSDLNEVVLAAERDGSADERVLRGLRNGGAAAFRCRRRLPGVTAEDPATNQEDAPDHPTMRHLAAYAARDGGEPCVWIQVHADLRRW
jgi:hypothetical protein